MNKNEPIIIFFNSTKDDMEHNIYAKKHFKLLTHSIKTIIGVIGKESQKYDTDNLRTPFMKSLFFNLLLRFKLFELPEDHFMYIMHTLYQKGQESKDMVVDRPVSDA